ncbi:magnesium chelatase subunit D family protein [Methanofervidicoccus abyssi]|uniref:Magnesium chelatase subunit D n=1 Tax=Methanofervidicoccus abyssi TaxID=2082189 RepID=A0A401HQI0_9EURY|nr:magnesium chelatase subunit D [Methanofervidicoccus abyssi]
MNKVFPFTAIVGQEKMKKALILNAINPKIGGVLIRGEKGTAKSTAVRALADLLPEIEVVENCPFNCTIDGDLCDICRENIKKGNLKTVKRKMKVVDLPIGCTEDRVIGTLDIERAIKEGVKALEPGILAEANGNILYIDEVNLLDDHIVDILLDVAAMGWNIIEREGIKIRHPSRFILVGTMNPEEGELRPQILDRFGLMVDVEGLEDVKDRVEVVKRVEKFNRDPEGFYKKFEEEQNKLRKKIENGRKILKDVIIKDDLLELIARICIELNIPTSRADITVARTAKAIAAFNGRTYVNIDDIKEACELALPHRMRRKPFEPPQLNHERINEIIEDFKNRNDPGNKDSEKDLKKNSSESVEVESTESRGHEGDKRDREGEGDRGEGYRDIQGGKDREDEKGSSERVFDAKGGIDPRNILKVKLRDDTLRNFQGRHVDSLSRRGRYVSYRIPKGKVRDIALDATIKASAPCQRSRLEKSRKDVKLIIKEEDIREKVRKKKILTNILFVVDASGSMGVMKRMEAVKGTILSILMDAYQKRNRVGMIAFRGKDAEIILPFTSSVELAEKCLRDIPTGGRTPLSKAFLKSYEVIKSAIRRDPNIIPIVIFISDFKPNVAVGKDYLEEIYQVCEKFVEDGINVILIDTEADSFVKIGIGKKIGEKFGFPYYHIDKLTSESILALLQ